MNRPTLHSRTLRIVTKESENIYLLAIGTNQSSRSGFQSDYYCDLLLRLEDVECVIVEGAEDVRSGI